MKYYIKRKPIVSLKSSVIVSICAVTILCSPFLFLKRNDDYDMFPVFLLLSIIIAFMYAVNILTSLQGYVFEKDYIHLRYRKIPIKKVKYNSIDNIVISNAIYNTMKFSGHADSPMGEKIIEGGKKKFLQYAYITVQTSSDIVRYLKTGANSNDVLRWDSEDTICLGICWFDALSELLSHTTSKIYILQDVYERFQGEFDAVLWLDKSYEERTYIVNDHPIAYQNYVAEGMNHNQI